MVSFSTYEDSEENLEGEILFSKIAFNQNDQEEFSETFEKLMLSFF